MYGTNLNYKNKSLLYFFCTFHFFIFIILVVFFIVHWSFIDIDQSQEIIKTIHNDEICQLYHEVASSGQLLLLLSCPIFKDIKEGLNLFSFFDSCFSCFFVGDFLFLVSEPFVVFPGHLSTLKGQHLTIFDNQVSDNLSFVEERVFLEYEL